MKIMDRVLALINDEFSTDLILNGRGLVYITSIGGVKTTLPLHRVVIRDEESNKQVVIATSSYVSPIRDGNEFIDPRMCVIPPGMSRATWMEYITRRLLGAYYGVNTDYCIMSTLQFYDPNYGISHINPNNKMRGYSYCESTSEVVVV